MTPVVVFAAIAFAIIGAFVGSRKGHPWNGAFAGLLLGPVGVLIIVLLPGRAKTPSAG